MLLKWRGKGATDTRVTTHSDTLRKEFGELGFDKSSPTQASSSTSDKPVFRPFVFLLTSFTSHKLQKAMILEEKYDLGAKGKIDAGKVQ
jgi:hypothetical protein